MGQKIEKQIYFGSKDELEQKSLVAFGSLFEIKNGLNKEKEAFGHGNYIVNYMDVNKNTRLNSTDISGLVNTTDTECARFEVKENDLFFTRTSESSEEIGLTAAIESVLPKTVFSGFILRARPLTELSSSYYAYMLRTYTYRKEIIKHSSITTRALTSGSLLASMKIPSTSYNKQITITNYLSQIDNLIIKQEYKINLNKQLYKCTNQFLISKGDICGLFSDIFETKSGTALEKYVTTIEESDLKFISIGNYTKNGKYLDDNKRINLNKITKKQLLNKNDLVMVLNDKSATGDIIGSTILIDNQKYIYNQRSQRLRCNSLKITPEFAWHYLNGKNFKNKVKTHMQGGTQYYVNMSSVEKFELVLPGIEKQKKYAFILSQMDKLIEIEEKKLIQLEKLKKYHLQQFFN